MHAKNACPESEGTTCRSPCPESEGIICSNLDWVSMGIRILKVRDQSDCSKLCSYVLSIHNDSHVGQFSSSDPSEQSLDPSHLSEVRDVQPPSSQRKPRLHAVVHNKIIISLSRYNVASSTVKPLIKDTPKEDKPLNKGQTKCTVVYKL